MLALATVYRRQKFLNSRIEDLMDWAG